MSTITRLAEALEGVAADVAGDVSVWPGESTYDAHPMGPTDQRFWLRVTVPPPAPGEHDGVLDELLDPAGGMRALVEGDRTLGGLCGHVTVVSASGYQTVPNTTGNLGEPGEWLAVTWLVSCLV